MPRREYHQYCAAAKALDLLGERWTLLLVRELLIGPRRYTDLLNALPGIGTNLLADRLKALEAAGVARRELLPPPAASTVYELTARGRELEEPIIALARWGLPLLAAREATDAWQPEWSILALRATFRPDRAAGLDERYQFEVGGRPFFAGVEAGCARTGLGRTPDPAVTVRADVDAFLDVANGSTTLELAEREGRYVIEGDRAAFDRCVAIFGLPPAPPPEA